MMTVIDLTECPICGEEPIYVDTEFCCEKCRPTMDIDLAVADLYRSLETLEGYHSCYLLPRKGILLELADRLKRTAEGIE